MADIAWFIPSLIQGSGGHRTMLQNAYALEQNGYNCHIYLEGCGEPHQASQLIERLFGYKFKSVRFGWNDIQPAAIAVATIWYSAIIVRDLPFDCTRCYFVQDYEAMFNPMGDAYLMAEISYRYGLIPITIGRWLKHELGKRFQIPACHFDFGADDTIYRPLPGIKREQAICFIYQPDKPRRCSRIGLEALGIVKHRRPDVQIYLYGSSTQDKGHIWFDHQHLGLLKLNDCNALYNRCAVGLCLSSTNPSRIPFEMMAAGLPVVELWRDNTLYDLPPDAVSLSDQTPESLAEAMIQLLDNTEERNAMSKAGIRYMSGRTLQNETNTVVEIFNKLKQNIFPKLEMDVPLYNKPPVTAKCEAGSFPEYKYSHLNNPSLSRLNSLPAPVRNLLRKTYRKARRFLLEG